jgi:hypothetical protein
LAIGDGEDDAVFTLIIGGVAYGMSAHVWACGLLLALLFMKLVDLTLGAFTATRRAAVLNSSGLFAAQCRREFLHHGFGPYLTGMLP